ncbi:hypothetical protein B0H19DRAFT_1073349 [Mycena capillaripes]|nr:hypothetical protein B0H19DRAFT_1073349 [Mycena capillaripes]
MSSRLDSGKSPTLPQELIDLILELTERKSLKACARVASSFRHTSQKRIFSHIKLMPASRYWIVKSLTLDKFSQILSSSPHLALDVRSLTVVEANGVGSVPWMRTDNFPGILSMLVNLTNIAIESDFWLDWNSFPAAVMKALQVTVALPSLTSVRLHYLRFDRSTELVSLLQCCRNVNSIVFSRVTVETMDNNVTSVLDARLGLSSLTLDPSPLPLLHSVTSVVDVRNLRYLHAALSSPEIETEIQNLLDATEHLGHYHVHLSHHHTDTTIINLQHLSHLRTLEFTLFFEFATSPDDYDPVHWAANILATSANPSPIQHVILNVNIDEKDLPYLFRLEDLEPFLVAPEMASLRKLTVKIDSFDLDLQIYSCQRDIYEAFPSLGDRDMLEIELLGVC